MSLEDFCVYTRISHRASESFDAGWCGLPKLMKNSVTSWVTISDLCVKYAQSIHLSGQTNSSSTYALQTNWLVWSGWFGAFCKPSNMKDNLIMGLIHVANTEHM